jgi:hypothetical protein
MVLQQEKTALRQILQTLRQILQTLRQKLKARRQERVLQRMRPKTAAQRASGILSTGKLSCPVLPAEKTGVIAASALS